jgi:pimeloyl-ACP methyl ester carboxylesterase
MGEDRTALSGITLDLWARFVANLVKQQPEPVVLIGHRRGGIVISQASEHVPERTRALVYLTAFLVPDGASLWSTMQQVPRDPVRPPDLTLSDDRTYSTLVPAAIRDTFYNMTSEERAARAASLVGPEPIRPWLTEAQVGRIRAVCLAPRWNACAIERSPLELQRLMVAATPCRVISLDTDHSPFFSAPEALCEQLHAAASPNTAVTTAKMGWRPGVDRNRPPRLHRRPKSDRTPVLRPAWRAAG